MVVFGNNLIQFYDMKKSLLLILVTYFVSVLLCSAQIQQARNPIIFADVPDLSIVRAGDTYYMSSTTMHMAPGVPIMKSKDLANWELVNYAYKTLGDIDALTLTTEKMLTEEVPGQAVSVIIMKHFMFLLSHRQQAKLISGQQRI